MEDKNIQTLMNMFLFSHGHTKDSAKLAAVIHAAAPEAQEVIIIVCLRSS